MEVRMCIYFFSLSSLHFFFPKIFTKLRLSKTKVKPRFELGNSVTLEPICTRRHVYLALVVVYEHFFHHWTNLFSLYLQRPVQFRIQNEIFLKILFLNELWGKKVLSALIFANRQLDIVFLTFIMWSEKKNRCWIIVLRLKPMNRHRE